MKEAKHYLLRNAYALKEGLRAALATVVHVEGAHFERPGSRTLVTQEEILLQNKLVTSPIEGEGTRHVLLEPLKGEGPGWLLEELIREAKDAVLVTLFSLSPSAPQPGTSLLYTEGGILTDLPGDLRHRVLGDVRAAARERMSCFTTYGPLHGFIEFIPFITAATEMDYQKHVF